MTSQHGEEKTSPQSTTDAPTVTSVEDLATRFPIASLPCEFGKYELLEVLGHGGMGIVYKAREISTNRHIALKMVRSVLSNSQVALERFEGEFRTVANLKHTHIVVLHDVGEVNGQWYFTMELLEGGSLFDELQKRPLEPTGAARLIYQIAQASHFAHQKMIFHRDIKPQNILLTTPLTGSGLPQPTTMARLSDFGLARSEDNTGQSIPGQAMGTPSYMPPEQARGDWNQIAPTSDVYSLGDTLYTILTGTPPF